MATDTDEDYLLLSMRVCQRKKANDSAREDELKSKYISYKFLFFMSLTFVFN